jgi:hypothetical protein
MVKVRNSFNLIKSINDDVGVVVTDMQGIKRVVTDFYLNLLGESSHVFSPVLADRVSNLICKKFSSCVVKMAEPITKEEVRKTLFSMNPNKAPGPDGFSVGFFHKVWSIVGEDVIEAIMEFFYFWSAAQGN